VQEGLTNALRHTSSRASTSRCATTPTVKGYLSEVLTRHALRDRTQLVVLAYESGLVRPGESLT